MLKHHRPQHSSIITKTAVSVATVFLAAIFLLIFGITYLNSYWMHHRILTDKQEFVNEISRSIDDQFKSLTTPLVSLGNQSAVHRLLNNYDTYDSNWLANIREIETSISQIHIYYDHVVDLVIMNTDSKILFSVTNALNRNYDFTGSEWFQNALEQPSAIKYVPPHGVDHYSRQNEKYANVFSVIYPVKKADKVEGYILCEVNANKISSLFYGTGIHSAEGYIMVDEDGKLIYDYINDRSPDEIGDIWTAINGNRTTDTPMQTIRNGNLYTGKQIQTTRWFIISETSNEIIRSSANSIWSFAIVIGCAAVGICILMLRYITRRLQKPVDSVIERISSYDGSGAVAFDDMDNSFREITVIRSKFEEMAGKINSLINDVYVAQMHQKDMELEMLVSQINPHFLYNVLQTIHGEAVLHGDREIEDMLSALGEILHYTIDHSNEMTTIAGEIQHVNNYLGFYKKRFPRLFIYSVDCPEELMDHQILKYLLQPVIENSIKHGFRDRKEGGEIRLRITRGQGDIVFEVFDNGHGISAERMEEIRTNMELALRNPGVGIANTNARIRLKYGASYGIALDSVAEEYTRVILTIPDEESR